MKFKVGDRVRIVRILIDDPRELPIQEKAFLNKEGTILFIDLEESKYQIRCKLDDLGKDDETNFRPDELLNLSRNNSMKESIKDLFR